MSRRRSTRARPPDRAGAYSGGNAHHRPQRVRQTDSVTGVQVTACDGHCIICVAVSGKVRFAAYTGRTEPATALGMH
jgi:hypothetical protein